MLKTTFYLFFISTLLLLSSCKKEIAPETKSNNAVMTFDKTEHDFGIINQGSVVYYIFNFKNTGATNLIISNAVGSCGCTIPEYPKEPIAPGQSGKMKVSFNSTGKYGHQEKTVTITANTVSGTEKLRIKASVKPKTGEESGIISH